MKLAHKIEDVARASVDELLHCNPAFDEARALCESPIEELFLVAAWSRGCWAGKLEWDADMSVVGLISAASGRSRTRYGHCRAFFKPQVQVGAYRVDFLFASNPFANFHPLLIAVECDGHEFHEKTKEQARRDKARDRELLTIGVTVVRFTGSEIWADAGKCAEQVLDLLWNGYLRDAQRRVDASQAVLKQALSRAQSLSDGGHISS